VTEEKIVTSILVDPDLNLKGRVAAIIAWKNDFEPTEKPSGRMSRKQAALIGISEEWVS